AFGIPRSAAPRARDRSRPPRGRGSPPASRRDSAASSATRRPAERRRAERSLTFRDPERAGLSPLRSIGSPPPKPRTHREPRRPRDPARPSRGVGPAFGEPAPDQRRFRGRRKLRALRSMKGAFPPGRSGETGLGAPSAGRLHGSRERKLFPWRLERSKI